MTIRRRIRNIATHPCRIKWYRRHWPNIAGPNAKINELVREWFSVAANRGLYVPDPGSRFADSHLFCGGQSSSLSGWLYFAGYRPAHWGDTERGAVPCGNSRLSELCQQQHASIRILYWQVLVTGIGLALLFVLEWDRIELALQPGLPWAASGRKAVCDKIITSAGINLKKP